MGVHFVNISQLSEGVILLKLVKKSVLGEIEMKYLSEEILKLSQDKPFHLISDITENTSEVTKEGRMYLEKFQKETPNYLSNSIILNSIWKSILLGAFLKIIKMPIPTKSFNTINGALNWINSFKVT